MRTRFFTWLGKWIPQHPWKIVIVALLLTAASAYLAVTRLALDADQDNLISEKLAYHKNYKDFLREFGDQEYLYLVVEANGDLTRAKAFVRAAAERFSKLPDIREVTYMIDNPVLEKSFLLLLTQEELKSLADMVGGGPFSIKRFAELSSLEELFNTINQEIAKPLSRTDEKKLTLGFTFLDGLVESLDDSIAKGTPYESKLEELFFGGGYFDPDGYLVTQNRKFVLCLIMPAKDYSTLAVIEEPLRRIRSAIDETRKEFPDVRAGLTGRPVLAADEMATSSHDMNLATILAIIAVSAIFIISFRGVTRPLLAMTALIMGIAWTYGFVTVVFGTLNLLSIVFAIILVGASIEYGIHVVARYQEELSKHRHIDEAIRRMLLAIGKADLTSAATTAGAFATLLFTNFRALKQLGAIAGMGIMLCLSAMIFVLPAMLIIRDHYRYGRRAVPAGETPKPAMRVTFISNLYFHPTLILAVAVVATVVLAPFVGKVKFDFNLLNLQAQGMESVKYERKLITESDESTWFTNAVANSPAESAKLAEQFRKLPTVRKVEDITSVVPLDQKARMFLIRKMAPAFAKIPPYPPLQKGGRGDASMQTLTQKISRFEESLARIEDEAFSAGRIDAVEELEGFRDRISSLVKHLEGNQDAAKRIEEFESAFFKDLHDKLDLLASGMHPVPLKTRDLPETIRQRFISSKGHYTVYITPKEDIWNQENLRRFVSDVRSVDKNVLGTPIEVYESGRIMVRAFLLSGVLAFIVIFVFVYMDFHAFKPAFMATFPLLLGGLWLLCVMGLFNIPFNLANFFAIPIIIGIGVDSGVHIIHRLQQERELPALGRATGTSVLLTAAANFIGFGMMMIAAHRGIASLGMIMSIGTVCCATAALLVMPPIAWRVLGFHEEK
jgi:hypothetical protein